MKILLLGDYSAVHKNLKEGLCSLGHEVDFASNGDGWKKIPRDIDRDYSNKIIPRFLADRIYPWIDIKKFINYDIVQIMSVDTIYKKFFFNKFFFKILKKNNKKIFLLAAGGDAFYWSQGRSRLKYGPFEDVLKYDLKSNFHPAQSKKFKEFNEFIADEVDGIIPTNFEYEISYKGHKNLLPLIPHPININKIKFIENIINGKLIIFHGLNRYGLRGTRHVEEAFKLIEKKYPNKFELIIDGNMPLEKYLNVLKRANIVIDQTYGHSIGMNGLYALALGKVVLGGSEPEALESLGMKNSPVINIKPNSQHIFEQIEILLRDINKIKEIGYLSRKYVENVHSHIGISKKFLDIWVENVEKN
jgi:hypothetical protein